MKNSEIAKRAEIIYDLKVGWTGGLKVRLSVVVGE
jgi:hypothetical protein